MGRRIAAGGMAEVFLATRTGAGGFEKTVAVKRILPHLCEDPETVAMFRDEAHLASRLSHPNIAQVFDLVEEDGALLLAMEWIDGKDLRRILRRAEQAGPRLTALRALAIARQVAEALAHAHGAHDADGEPLQIVHRDVSPHNVMITFEGSVKLTDFGIARAAQRSVNTATGMIKGKVAYMSPEQARGEPVDARTDVFALGVVLWEMLCGRRLFSGESDVAILRAVQEQAAPPPSSIDPALTESVDALVLSALHPDREARLPSAAAFARRAGELLHELAAHPDEQALAPWMRALYPAESRGERQGTLRRPAAPASPTPPAGAPGGGSGDEAPAAQPATRPDHPLALEEPELGAANATAALSAEVLREKTILSRLGLLVGVLSIGALAGLGLRLLGDDPLPATEPPPAPSREVPREEPATSTEVPDEVLPHEVPATPTEETLEPAEGPGEGSIAGQPPSSTAPRRAPKARSRPPEAAPPPPTPDPPREVPATSTEPSPQVPATQTTPRTTGPARGGTRVLSRVGEERSTVRELPRGTRLEVRLLDSARAGERVRLTLSRSVLASGRLALPRGTRLVATPRAVDRRLHLEVQGGTTPTGEALELHARAVDSSGAAGILAFDPVDPGAPLLLAPGTDLQLELLQPLTLD
ncbi:MAG: protein kinase [Deltaproteobacteria bacterium]|nr:protein kinase [Deltaproteobacteria bacterium]